MKVAILLSGCGLGDGSQIEEVMLIYLALDKYGVDYTVSAPDKPQFDVINHVTESRQDVERNVLVESARIGRGRIVDFDALTLDALDALILPGGLGVFKNLSNYVSERRNFEVDPAVNDLIHRFHQGNKPILAMCASTVLVAKSLEGTAGSLKVATANDAYKDLIIDLGCEPINCKANEVVYDEKNKVISTPAFLASKNMNEINAGIDEMVRKLIRK